MGKLKDALKEAFNQKDITEVGNLDFSNNLRFDLIIASSTVDLCESR